MSPTHEAVQTTEVALASARARRPSALIVSVIEALLPGDDPDVAEPERAGVVARVTPFVVTQLEMLPAHLRLLLRCGMLAFGFATVVARGRAFGALSGDQRRAWVEAWAYGGSVLARKLFRPIRSLAIVCYYSDPAVVRMLSAPARRGVSDGREGPAP